MNKMLAVLVLLISGALPLIGGEGPVLPEPEMTVYTIYRSSADVVVNTRIHLQVVDGDTDIFQWKIVNQPMKGILIPVGEEEADTKARAFAKAKAGTKAKPAPKAKAGSKAKEYINDKRIEYIYIPNVGQSGTDEFEYRVTECTNDDPPKCDDGTHVKGTVTVEIEKQGIRWEIEAYGGTGLGDSGQNSGEAIGSTGENFLFKLDWLFNSPRSKDRSKPPSASDFKSAVNAGSDLTDSLKVFDPDNASGVVIKAPIWRDIAPQNSRFSFQTGIMNLPVATEIQEQLRSGDEGSSEEADNENGNSTEDSDETKMSLQYQRAFTSKMAFSYNFAFDADEEGTIIEFGPMVQGNLDIYLDDDDFSKQNGVTYLNVGRFNDRRGFFGFEAGFRFRLTQFEDNPDTIVLKKDEDKAKYRRMNPRNSDDLLIGEVVYQRREALGNLALGETRNRIAARFIASPRVPGSKEKARFLIGAEFSRDFANRGPQDVRLFYGFDVSLPGLFGR